jgi:hypothetical protein
MTSTFMRANSATVSPRAVNSHRITIFHNDIAAHDPTQFAELLHYKFAIRAKTCLCTGAYHPDDWRFPRPLRTSN